MATLLSCNTPNPLSSNRSHVSSSSHSSSITVQTHASTPAQSSHPRASLSSLNSHINTKPTNRPSLSTSSVCEKHKVRAICRIKPLLSYNTNHSNNNYHSVLPSSVIPKGTTQVAFQQRKYAKIIQQTFDFDGVYHNTSQEALFKSEVEPLIKHALAGKNVSILAYGPTGSGKTFTAFGVNEDVGLFTRLVSTLLSTNDASDTSSALIKLSALEIYNERAYDLLSTDRSMTSLPVRTDGKRVIVQGLHKIRIRSLDEYYKLYARSMKRRKTAFTALNAHSSRSHAIFTLHTTRDVGNDTQVCGKLSIADLAGSENNKRTGNQGKRLNESKNINKSLLALGAVIDALNRKVKTRPPYRDSILTRLLQESLGGNSIATMICCCSGQISESSMTRRCLEFGSSTRKIENKVIAHISEKQEVSVAIKERKRKREARQRVSGVAVRMRKKAKFSVGDKENVCESKESGEVVGQDLNASSISVVSIVSDATMDVDGVDEVDESEGIEVSGMSRCQATPSKSVPGDGQELLAHERAVNAQLLQQINELTEFKKETETRLQELTDKLNHQSEERAVYSNDAFGLPPKMTPQISNSVMAKELIREARVAEKNSEFEHALRLYQRAQKLVPKVAPKLQKKIVLLKQKADKQVSVDVTRKALSFEDETAHEIPSVTKEQQPKAIKKKKKRILKRKIIKAVEPVYNENGDVVVDEIKDEDERVIVSSNCCMMEYVVDETQLLHVMNTADQQQLLGLKTIGSKKAKAIFVARPFQDVTTLRSVKGMSGAKAWHNFLDRNRLVFEKGKRAS